MTQQTYYTREYIKIFAADGRICFSIVAALAKIGEITYIAVIPAARRKGEVFAEVETLKSCFELHLPCDVDELEPATADDGELIEFANNHHVIAFAKGELVKTEEMMTIDEFAEWMEEQP